MRTNIVFTLTGPDRVGIVEAVTRILFAHGGNVETSRMARLGGEFAMLMLVALPGEQLASLEKGVEELISQGYKVTTSLTAQPHGEVHPGWLPYRVEVNAADHEGIIHEVARYLSERGINIESMETETTPAPLSGTPLFAMTALVAVPPALAGESWESALEAEGNRLNLDITVSPLQKQ
jgi:glycine cleavage system transcriptional repressor